MWPCTVRSNHRRSGMQSVSMRMRAATSTHRRGCRASCAWRGREEGGEVPKFQDVVLIGAHLGALGDNSSGDVVVGLGKTPSYWTTPVD